MTYFRYFSSRGHGEGAAKGCFYSKGICWNRSHTMPAISILRPDISWCQCHHTTENAGVSQGWDPAASFQGHAPRPAAYVVIIPPNSPLPVETGNPEWKCFTALPEQDGRWGQRHVSHIWACLHHWALSSIMSNTVRRTQKCIRESVLPHQALRCYSCWISSTAYRTAGKRHLVARQGMPGNRTCFMYHLASEMWATARAREEAKHFVIFPQLVSWSKMGVTNRL